MGKISVTGSAEIEFEADVMNLELTVAAHGDSTDAAVKKGKERVEKLLGSLQKIGIDTDKITLKQERTGAEGFGDQKKSYVFRKRLAIKCNASLPLLEEITGLISGEDIQAEYDVSFDISDKAETEKQVIRQAIADSRRKAELFAEETGHKIIGISKADFDAGISPNAPRAMSCAERGVNCDSLASKLSIEKIKVAKTVSITWITNL